MGIFSSIETGSYKPTNWIEKLNQRDANEIDRAYWTREGRKWPVDLMGGAGDSARRPTLTVDPKLRQTILDTEQLHKDDEPTRHALVGDLSGSHCYQNVYFPYTVREPITRPHVARLWGGERRLKK